MKSGTIGMYIPQIVASYLLLAFSLLVVLPFVVEASNHHGIHRKEIQLTDYQCLLQKIEEEKSRYALPIPNQFATRIVGRTTVSWHEPNGICRVSGVLANVSRTRSVEKCLIEVDLWHKAIERSWQGSPEVSYPMPDGHREYAKLDSAAWDIGQKTLPFQPGGGSWPLEPGKACRFHITLRYCHKSPFYLAPNAYVGGESLSTTKARCKRKR